MMKCVLAITLAGDTDKFIEVLMEPLLARCNCSSPKAIKDFRQGPDRDGSPLFSFKENIPRRWLCQNS